MDLLFVKRIGTKYPGNKGEPHLGTNLQEVLRACIDRLKYLQNQNPCEENPMIIKNLQTSIWMLENRAARLHNRTIRVGSYVGIEHFPICEKCGHIGHKCAG